MLGIAIVDQVILLSVCSIMYFTFQVNMTLVNFAMKSIVFIWTVIPFVKSDAADLSWKPREMREYHKEKHGNREPHFKSSYCPIRSRFQAISNSSFECKKQDLDATNGKTI